MKKPLYYFVILFALIAIIETKVNSKNKSDYSTKWKSHKTRQNLQFKHEQEEIKAQLNFNLNEQYIEKHNNNESNSFKLEHNKFSHLSPNEFKNSRGLIQIKTRLVKREIYGNFSYPSQNHSFQFFRSARDYVPPASVDWVKAGWNTQVRDQKNCSDCWAFAATASIEAAIWLQNKNSIILSPKQLTDCSFSYGNKGCNGGNVALAFDYAIDNGIVEEKHYPFYAKESICDNNTIKKNRVYKVSKYYMIESGNDLALMEALDKFGPIPVMMSLLSRAFSLYKGGLFTECSANIDHAVLLTGYGIDNKKNKYWTIKNQFGSNWGVNGYMNITRNIKNACDISSAAFIPIL